MGRTEKHDETTGRFSQFCEKRPTNSIPTDVSIPPPPSVVLLPLVGQRKAGFCNGVLCYLNSVTLCKMYVVRLQDVTSVASWDMTPCSLPPRHESCTEACCINTAGYCTAQLKIQIMLRQMVGQSIKPGVEFSLTGCQSVY